MNEIKKQETKQPYSNCFFIFRKFMLPLRHSKKTANKILLYQRWKTIF